jgi:glycosyltransferase involved in cell wall biosynthesis
MRILLLTDHFYPDLSSGGRLLTDLAAGLVESGDRVQVITAFASYNTIETGLAKEEFLGVKIERVISTKIERSNIIERLKSELLFCFAVFFKALFSKEIDIIFTLSSPPFLPIFVLILSKIKQIPYIYVVMDVFPDIAVSLGITESDALIFKIWDSLSKLALHHALRIVVLGRCMLKVIENKVAKSKVPIEIIHNWSNSELIKPISKQENPFLIKHAFLKEKFIVQYSGNLGRFQDFETILVAAEKLRENELTHFLIIGDGVQRQWLVNEIQKRNLKNITLLPFQAQEDLVYSINAADIALVTLKRGAEGLGVPSKFYPILAAGKPVVAIMAEWAEVALTVKEFGIGIVLEQGDVDGLVTAIKQLSTNSDELERMGKRSRELFLQRFDRPYAIEAYQKCLHLALGLDR